MPPRKSLRRIGCLLGVHFLLGAAGIGGALFFPRYWPGYIVVGYLSLLVSQALLLGIWLGFSNQRWFVKVLGGMVGAVWIVMMSVAPSWDLSSNASWQACGMILPIPVVVTLVACGFRLWIVRLQVADRWPAQSTNKEWQFTLRSLFGFMLGISLLLAASRFLRSIGGPGSWFLLGLSCLIGVLATCLLIWSCLGRGRPLVRVPIATACLTVVGFAVPYFSHDPVWWRLLVWGGLLLSIAAIMSASLLVVRSCGFRLIPTGLFAGAGQQDREAGSAIC